MLTEEQKQLLQSTKAGLVVTELEHTFHNKVLDFHVRRCIKWQWNRWKRTGTASFQIMPVENMDKLQKEYREYEQSRKSFRANRISKNHNP